MKAPVALFVYKRLEKTEECIQALEKNFLVEDTDLFIFCDGYKNETDREAVLRVQEFINNYTNKSNFRQVYVKTNEINRGLANSVIQGVSEVIHKYGKVIVVEDDLITAVDFLQYMNDALDFYQDEKEYGSISAYTYPLKKLENYSKDIYVLRKGECWGWATWEDRWNLVKWDVPEYEQLINDNSFRDGFDKLQYGFTNMLIDWKNGVVDSWAVRWCLYLFLEKKLTVYPTISRARNIGLDNSGTNCGNDFIFDTNVSDGRRRCHFELLDCDYKIEKEVCDYTKMHLKDYLKRIIWKMKKMKR